MKKVLAVLLVAAVICMAGGCVSREKDEEKIRNLDFTVVAKDEIPEEFFAQIEEQKNSPFHLTYMDQGYLYIAVGYGKQETSGYSIRVTQCSESETKLCFLTELVGPDSGEKTVEADTWPWIAVKLEETDKKVEFK